jgi:hypothetical protein
MPVKCVQIKKRTVATKVMNMVLTNDIMRELNKALKLWYNSL